MAASQLDIGYVRSLFPAFHHPDWAEWIHLENAGGSYVPRHVIDLLTQFYTATKVQPYGRGGPSEAAGDAMDRAISLLPATLNAQAGEVHIGPSTSQNTYVLANALRAGMIEGDEVIVTNQDHEANIGSWRRLAETGLTLKEWSVDPETGLLDVDDLETLLNARTRLVCVTHASNLAGTINPVRQIADLVHTAGGLLVVDGVSWAPHAAVDVVDLDCDIYLYSTYKTYGPHLGLCYTRPEVLDQLAHQGHYFNATKPTTRLTPAGPDHAAIAAAAGIVDYYEDLADHHRIDDPDVDLVGRIAKVFDLVADHEERLMRELLGFLATKPIRLIGVPDADRSLRAPTIAFTSERATPAEVATTLADVGIGIGHGDFYARRLVDAMGIENEVIRISAVHYNTVDEIDRTIEVLDKTL